MTRRVSLLFVTMLLASGALIPSSAADRTAGVGKIPAIERGNERQPLYVSFARLAANPGRYRGKDIQLAGYLSAAFEDTAVYATHDAYKHGIRTDSVALLFDDQDFAIARKLHGRFVLVRGLLSGVNESDDYLPIGTISAVIRLREIDAAP